MIENKQQTNKSRVSLQVGDEEACQEKQKN
jgi:hypothetical protein